LNFGSIIDYVDFDPANYLVKFIMAATDFKIGLKFELIAIKSNANWLVISVIVTN